MRFFLGSLLALCFVGPAWSDGGYLMSSPERIESLRILSELELGLSTLKGSLKQADETSQRLEQDLAVLSQTLSEVRAKLESSEVSLAEVSDRLTKALQALTDSEQSFKAYQQWETLKITAGVVVGLVVGFFLTFAVR